MGNLPTTPHGQIFLKTSNPFYIAGENVTGEIYLNLTQPFQGNTIHLKVKGEKNCRWEEQKPVGEPIQTAPELPTQKLFTTKVKTTSTDTNSQFFASTPPRSPLVNIVSHFVLPFRAIYQEHFTKLSHISPQGLNTK